MTGGEERRSYLLERREGLFERMKGQADNGEGREFTKEGGGRVGGLYRQKDYDYTT